MKMTMTEAGSPLVQQRETAGNKRPVETLEEDSSRNSFMKKRKMTERYERVPTDMDVGTGLVAHLTEETEDDDGNGHFPSTKRKKISFQDVSSSKEITKSVDVNSPRSGQVGLRRILTPLKPHGEPTCITMNGVTCIGAERKDGRICYAPEEFYGQNLDYQKTLGKSSMGVAATVSTKRIVSEVKEGLKDRSITKIEFFKNPKQGPVPTVPLKTSPKRFKKSSSIVPVHSKSIAPVYSMSDKLAQSPTAASATPALTPVIGWENCFAKNPKGQWKCNSCTLQNQENNNVCLACKAKKSSIEASTFTPASTSLVAKEVEEPFEAPAPMRFTFAAPMPTGESLLEKKDEGGSATSNAAPMPGKKEVTFGWPKVTSERKDDNLPGAQRDLNFSTSGTERL